MSGEFLKKQLRVLVLLLATYPVALILALMIFAFEARVHLGYWPSYGRPDPKQLGWDLQYNSLMITLVCFPGASLGAVILALIGRSRIQDFPFWESVITTALCVVVFLAYARIDPGGFIDWFID